MLLAVAAESGSWAHLIGLLAAAAVAFVAVGTHQWWMHYRDPSPTPPDGADIDVTPGETDDLTPDDTGFDTADDPPAGGRRVVTLPDGTRVVRYVSHIIDDPGEDEDEETREDMADRLVAGGGSYADWVREIMGAFDVSEATAKRAIRDARDRIDA